MELSRTPNDQKLQLCRWYFRVGFLLLPFVWAVNAVWFFREAFLAPPYDEQKQIKKYVLLSALGALCLGVIPTVAWVTTFQTQRAAWGVLGERLSFIIPLGRA